MEEEKEADEEADEEEDEEDEEAENEEGFSHRATSTTCSRVRITIRGNNSPAESVTNPEKRLTPGSARQAARETQGS